MSYADRYHPAAGVDLIARMRRFPILAERLQRPDANPIATLLESSHATTRRLALFLCAHFYDGSAGGVDIVDLLQRTDAANKAALLAYLAEI